MMSLKLDMVEAYNRLEWDFLEEVLDAFHKDFVQIIRECISSVSFLILLNGPPFGDVCLSRGLRQGDPLS